MQQLSMYRDIEISEKQIENGQTKEAKTALADLMEELQEKAEVEKCIQNDRYHGNHMIY